MKNYVAVEMKHYLKMFVLDVVVVDGTTVIRRAPRVEILRGREVRGAIRMLTIKLMSNVLKF